MRPCVSRFEWQAHKAIYEQTRLLHVRRHSDSFRGTQTSLHMHDYACQSTLQCVANGRFVVTSLTLTDQTLRICSSGRTWSKKAIRCSSASERPHVKARSAAGPISRSRSGGMADLVGHRGRNGEEEASQGAGSPLNEGLGRALRWDLRERWLTVLSAQNAHSVRPRVEMKCVRVEINQT